MSDNETLLHDDEHLPVEDATPEPAEPEDDYRTRYEHLQRKLGEQSRELGELRKLKRESEAPPPEEARGLDERAYARCLPDAEYHFTTLVEDRAAQLEAAGHSAEEIARALQAEQGKLQERAWQRALRDDARLQTRISQETASLKSRVGQSEFLAAAQEVVDARFPGVDPREVAARVSQAVPLDQWEAAPPEVKQQALEIVAVYEAYRTGALGGAAKPPPAKAPNVGVPRAAGGRTLSAQAQHYRDALRKTLGNDLTDAQLDRAVAEYVEE